MNRHRGCSTTSKGPVTAYLEEILLGARDLAIAAYDFAVGRRRRQYCYELVINAPKDLVRRLTDKSEKTFESGDFRSVREPLAGVEGAEVVRHYVGGQLYASLAYRHSETAPDTFLARYLPEFCQDAAWIGTDDTLESSFKALPDGSTKLRMVRTLTHRRAGTRLSAPLGLRQGARRLKAKAELEAGHAAAHRPDRLRQSLWLAAAIASFWWLFGWLDAAIVTLVIILHELGHAVAMLLTGRGVRFITLVPFVGGLAVPRRHYESDWQRAFVAFMGPGLSLVPTLVLFWLAFSIDSALAARAAFVFALINAPNLLPLIPLDGGVIVNALLRAVHIRLNRAIAWLGVASVSAIALYTQSVLVGIVFMFGVVQLVYESN